MARTHAWLLHPGPPPEGGWIRRLWRWLRSRMGGAPPALTGPVELDGLDALAESLELRLGKRYRCLPVIPRPGALASEALRELLTGDRLVILTSPGLSPSEHSKQMREVRYMLRDRSPDRVFLLDWDQQEFNQEAHAWAHRMTCILCLRPSTDAPRESPTHLQSPEFQRGLADAIQRAEREAGWTVPEDWIRDAVARAWDAIDAGQSIEEATTLPDPPTPSLPWIDEVLASSTEETS